MTFSVVYSTVFLLLFFLLDITVCQFLLLLQSALVAWRDVLLRQISLTFMYIHTKIIWLLRTPNCIVLLTMFSYTFFLLIYTTITSSRHCKLASYHDNWQKHEAREVYIHAILLHLIYRACAGMIVPNAKNIYHTYCTDHCHDGKNMH